MQGERQGLRVAGELQIPGGRGARACAARSSVAAGARPRTRGSGRGVGGKRGAEVTAAARDRAGPVGVSVGTCSVGRGAQGKARQGKADWGCGCVAAVSCGGEAERRSLDSGLSTWLGSAERERSCPGPAVLSCPAPWSHVRGAFARSCGRSVTWGSWRGCPGRVGVSAGRRGRSDLSLRERRGNAAQALPGIFGHLVPPSAGGRLLVTGTKPAISPVTLLETLTWCYNPISH